MKRFSIRRMGESAQRAVRRFPFALLSALTAGVMGAIAADRSDGYPFVQIMLAAQLGIPLFLAVAVTAERHERLGLPYWSGWMARLLTLGLLVWYCLSLPRHLDEPDMRLFLQLNVGAHLLVAVLPFLARGEHNGMWQYNLALLMRFLTAAFFSAVLFAGLSLAIGALDMLFGVDLDDEIYLQLLSLIGFAFNTAYFLGGVPPRLEELDHERDYPKVVRIFAQYILAPLVAVYMAILLAYLGKVVILGEWPSGWIGYLVSSVAAAGILSLLLLKPLSEQTGIRWVGVYARLYHILMIPAAVMLILAVYKRIDQYGFTEDRYLLGILAVWLIGIAVAGCFRRRPFLKIIPLTLAALAFLTALGPWSAQAVSRHSQLGRLDRLLSANDRLQDGVIVPADSPVPAEDRAEISAVLRYLFKNHGPDALGDRVGADLEKAILKTLDSDPDRRRNPNDQAQAVAEYAHVPFEWRAISPGRVSHNFRRDPEANAISARGFDLLIPVTGSLSAQEPIVQEAGAYRFVLPPDSLIATVFLRGDRMVDLPIGAFLDSLRARQDVSAETVLPDSLLGLGAAEAGLEARLQVYSIFWTEREGEIEHGRLEGILLLRHEQEP